MPNQRLQLTRFWWGGSPGFGLLSTTEIGDEGCIQLIRFVTAQLAAGIAPDAGWIDHTHPVARRIQILGHPFRVATRRFQTHGLHLPFVQPALQLRVTLRRIVDLRVLCLALLIHTHHIQRILAHIDPHHTHPSPPHLALTAWPPAQSTLYTSSRGRTQRASDTVRLRDLGLHAWDSSTIARSSLQGRVSLSSALAAFLPSIIYDTKGGASNHPPVETYI